eukprot:EG_transcript_14401
MHVPEEILTPAQASALAPWGAPRHVWPLPRFPVPPTLLGRSYDDLLHPVDWLFGLQVRFDADTSNAILSNLNGLSIELLSQVLQHQWQTAVSNLHPTEMRAQPVPHYPTVGLAVQGRHVVCTVGWPRHFSAGARRVQRVAQECAYGLEEILQFLSEHWRVPSCLFGPSQWDRALFPVLPCASQHLVRRLLLLNARLRLLPEDLVEVVLQYLLQVWRVQWHNKHGMGCLPPLRGAAGR